VIKVFKQNFQIRDNLSSRIFLDNNNETILVILASYVSNKVRISQTLTLKIWGWITVSIANFKGKIIIKN